MDDLRPDAVAARVAAWHNRHPLARRITAAHVQAVGFVALPFVARPGAARSDALADLPTLPLSDATLGPPPSGGSLRARARAQAHPPSTLPPGEDPPFDGPAAGAAGLPAGGSKSRSGPLAALQAWWARQSGRRRAAALVNGKAKLRAKALKPAFSERFLPGLAPSTVARWALRHGRLEVRKVSPNALRRVLPDAKLLGDSNATTTLYLATAAVEVGKHRARVLLGDGPAAGAIGGRLFSPSRVLGSFAALALAASALVGPPLPQVQDLAKLPHTEAWHTAMGWLRRHSGNDPALQTAGPRLASGGAPAAAAAASGAANLDGSPNDSPNDSPNGSPTDRAGDSASNSASNTSPPPDTVRMAEAPTSHGQAAEAALPPATAEPTELPVRMADAAPPRRDAASHASSAAPASPALFPDDPPPGSARPDAGPDATAGAQTAEAASPRKAAPALNPALRGGVASIKPQLDESTKAAARKAVADLRAARGDAAPAPPAPPAPPTAVAAAEPAPAPMPALPAAPPAQLPAPATPPVMLRVAAAPVPPAVKQAAAGAPAYALSTRLLRTRAESEQVLVAWRALLAGDPRNPLNVSVMPAGEDWRVVCWPFTSRQEAERARSLLAARGMRAETIDF